MEIHRAGEIHRIDAAPQEWGPMRAERVALGLRAGGLGWGSFLLSGRRVCARAAPWLALPVRLKSASAVPGDLEGAGAGGQPDSEQHFFWRAGSLQYAYYVWEGCTTSREIGAGGARQGRRGRIDPFPANAARIPHAYEGCTREVRSVRSQLGVSTGRGQCARVCKVCRPRREAGCIAPTSPLSVPQEPAQRLLVRSARFLFWVRGSIPRKHKLT